MKLSTCCQKEIIRISEDEFLCSKCGKLVGDETKEWEEEYDKLFPMPPYFQPTPEEPIYDLDVRKKKIKDFISNLISQAETRGAKEERERIGEITEKYFEAGRCR